MNIIFLDIDGVLNCEKAYIDGECNYVEFTLNGNKEHYQTFCSWSKYWLNKLIVDTDSKIVISSTWRLSGIDFIKKVWEEEKMSGEIIGVTPTFLKSTIKGYRIPRGCEIDFFLENELGFHHIFWSKDEQQKYIDKSNVNNYIIIDDDSDMLYSQRKHFVQVLPSPRNIYGFNEEHYNLGMDILNKSIIDIYF